MARSRWNRTTALAWRRLRERLWPIVQTAAAAVAAWYLARYVLGVHLPLFAPIAAVIALGATHGQQGRRVVELVGGVVLGISVADLIVHAIGAGPWQAGVMIVLAMGAAVALGGGELLVSEAAVSAILIVTLTPTEGLSPDRFLEAGIGGGVGLRVAVLRRALAEGVWELASGYDRDGREPAVRQALGPATRISSVAEEARDVGLAEFAAPVRSVAVDLVRAADLAAAATPGDSPTEELLVS